MTEPVKKKARVLEAKYIAEADSIVLLCEWEKGKLRHQIHSSCFTFGNKDKATEMQKTAELMIGKNIWMAFDTDLEGKIKDHYPLKY